MAFALVLVVLVYLALVLLGFAWFLASILAVESWSDALWTVVFWVLIGLGVIAVLVQA